MLNPEYLLDTDKLPLYGYFGKLLAIACRHAIMVPLSLTDLIWKPFVRETVNINDLKATDVHTVRSLGEIAEGGMAPGQAIELLTQALFSSSLRPRNGVLACHPAAMAAAVRSFISPDITGKESTNIGRSTDNNNSKSSNNSNNNSNNYSDINDNKTKNNRATNMRIRSICDLLLNDHLTAHTTGLEHVLRGVAAVLPTEIFPIFSALELKTIFCGQDEVDLGVLKRATVYEGGVGPADR